MAYKDIIAYLNIDATSDAPLFRGSSIPNYYIDVDKIVHDPNTFGRILDELRVETPISSRMVLNNADSDDRSFDHLDIIERTPIFGEFVRLASVSYIADILDEPDHLLRRRLDPRDYEYVKSLDTDEISGTLNRELDEVFDTAEPNITAYLFGRDVVELDDIGVHIREGFYNFTTDVMYHAYMHLCEATDQWIYVFESHYETNGYFTGKWDEDRIELYLRGDSITNVPDEMTRGRY